jgi:hypothetical protein
VLYPGGVNTAWVGNYFPCSFSEGTEGWEEGIDIINGGDFMSDLWFHNRNNEFRKKVIDCRDNEISCCIYDI